MKKHLKIVTILLIVMLVLSSCATTIDRSSQSNDKVAVQSTPQPTKETYTKEETAYIEYMIEIMGYQAENNDNFTELMNLFYPGMQEWRDAFLAVYRAYLAYDAALNGIDVPDRFTTYHNYMKQSSKYYLDAFSYIAKAIDSDSPSYMDMATEAINKSTSYMEKANIEFNKVKIN